MDGAGSADDEKTVILLSDDSDGFLATLQDGCQSLLGGGNLLHQEGWLDERVLTEDWRAVSASGELVV